MIASEDAAVTGRLGKSLLAIAYEWSKLPQANADPAFMDVSGASDNRPIEQTPTLQMHALLPGLRVPEHVLRTTLLYGFLVAAKLSGTKDDIF